MMDNQFNSTYMPFAPTQASQQSSLSAYAGSTQQAQTSASQASLTPQQHTPHEPNHTTLPPLQGQNGFAQFNSVHFPHQSNTSQTPTAPPTPVTQPANGYAHLSPANSIGHPHNAFGSSYPITTQSLAFPPNLASAVAPSPTSGLPTIRPMPPASMAASMAALPSLATAHLGQQSAFVSNEEAPTHVVGSQGRRGILPSAPGRPNATAAGTVGAPTKSVPLQKDADGKFPCPHCNKTYLHAKHLKRHMLRHTGDRPYSCHLCKDTFSRSDILKRHFQKCSIRRGNPSGLSHLAHQRRSGNSNNRLSISQQDGPIGLASLSEVAGNNPYSAGGMSEQGTPVNGAMSNRTSRANSLITPGSMGQRNSVAGLGIVSPNGHAQDISHTQSHFAAPNMHGYAMTNGGPMNSSYAFAQSAINPQFYQTMQTQPPLPFLGGHANPRFDHGPNNNTNSPHQQSPSVGEPHQQLDNVRLLAHEGQDSFINGNVNLGNEGSKTEHQKHFSTDFNDDNAAPLGPPWS